MSQLKNLKTNLKHYSELFFLLENKIPLRQKQIKTTNVGHNILTLNTYNNKTYLKNNI